MFVKVFNRGTGKSGGIDYLTNEHDADGNVREVEPKILRGNKELTKSLIDASDFKQRYCSGVLSFSEKNIPEDAKQKIIDDFETRALFPGMKKSSYNSLWVEHRDKGRLELHFVVPTIHLESGKALVPYYHKVDMPRVDNWQEVTNYDYGFSSPKEPERQKTLSLSRKLPAEKKKLLLEINTHIEKMISNKEINNRDDVIKTLEGVGLEITRKAKQSISIKNPDKGKRNIRLKGRYYEQSFTSIGELERDYKQARTSYQRDLGKSIERLRTRLGEQVAHKSKYNAKRYGQELGDVQPTIHGEHDKSLETIRRDVEASHQATKDNSQRIQQSSNRTERSDSTSMVATVSSGVNADVGLGDGVDGNNGVHDKRHQRNKQRIEGVEVHASRSEEKGQVLDMRQPSVRTDRRKSASLPRWLQNLKNAVEGKYERIRASFNASIRAVEQAIRGRSTHTIQSSANFDKALGTTISSNNTLRATEYRTNKAISGLSQSLQSSDRSFEQGLKKRMQLQSIQLTSDKPKTTQSKPKPRDRGMSFDFDR